MAKVKTVKRSDNRGDSLKNTKSSPLLRRAEVKLEKKQQELLQVKAQHQKIAREFIDLWVKVRRIKRQLKLI